MLNKIKFSFKVADKQTGLLTPSHTLFKCKIKVDGCQYTFKYQCNTAYTEPNLLDCVYSLITNMDCYDTSRDVIDFCNEFGYNDAKGVVAYKACKKTSKALHRLFTNEELAEIGDELMQEDY